MGCFKEIQRSVDMHWGLEPCCWAGLEKWGVHLYPERADLPSLQAFDNPLWKLYFCSQRALTNHSSQPAQPLLHGKCRKCPCSAPLAPLTITTGMGWEMLLHRAAPKHILVNTLHEHPWAPWDVGNRNLSRELGVRTGQVARDKYPQILQNCSGFLALLG